MRCSWCRSRWGRRKARSICCSGSWDSTPRSASIPRSWPACGTSYGSAPDWRSCGWPGAARLPSAPEMTIVTHILATTLGVQAMQLHGREAALAYAFGVGVDVDHAIKAPYYLKRSEEHTSELQSRLHLVCRLLLEKKKIPTSPRRLQVRMREDRD